MKIREINGSKYSLSPFDGYALRVKIEYPSTDLSYRDNKDIYTNETNKAKIIKDLLIIVTKKIKSFEIANFTTKEQDEANSVFIKEWLDGV